jgi:hypothetical protein
MNKEASPIGRPTLYIEGETHLKVLGLFWLNENLTNNQLIKKLNISHDTFCKWLNKHEEFAEAVEMGHEGLRNKLIGSAIKESIAYKYQEEFMGKDGPQMLTKHARPNASILKLMLSNIGIREKVETIEKTELNEITPAVLAILTNEEKQALNSICEKINASK